MYFIGKAKCSWHLPICFALLRLGLRVNKIDINIWVIASLRTHIPPKWGLDKEGAVAPNIRRAIALQPKVFLPPIFFFTTLH